MAVVDYFKNAKEFTVYEAGQVIFDEGQSGDKMYAVKEGIVDVVHKDRVLESIDAGAFFGEMALIDSAPRSAMAVAQTDCKIVVVDKAHFLFLVQETPTFALQVMHIMANRLRVMNELV
ncbi:MAG: Crp/Fnr family transcriptional regulator [Chitinophagaceae bacterium]|nr:Crp/Fnr family transcriptional regulator [Anaerolineae bacterium]